MDESKLRAVKSYEEVLRLERVDAFVSVISGFCMIWSFYAEITVLVVLFATLLLSFVTLFCVMRTIRRRLRR